MFSSVFDQFVKDSPVSVMARAAMERVLNPKQLDEWFDLTVKEQYTKDLSEEWISLRTTNPHARGGYNEA